MPRNEEVSLSSLGIQMPYNHLNVHVVERKEEKG